ncbi:carboxy-S-adenosyl-L-methionine synthase CmoA [Spirochaeta isovalerica]|uniref:Carboxy-S-adenosyl-L-methionine synthase n=1 Tax=Spirochaeta isovalerica TaxID=150 RepID=A0A841RA39_9SPIO|nr:carboxy-S-adenosyl-L-methionine synthase CmoA [Spirochaeta isovalerica]MBB6480775.1 tRNA (cmo5U34)-methyltransferase [Spirochaeta isovalerica]
MAKDSKKQDKVFAEQITNIRPFEFNENVAHVFDDMAERSIPFYKEVQKMVTTLALTYFQEGSVIYDLGSSTATTISLISQGMKDHDIEDYSMIGIDSSAAMCHEAEVKLDSVKADKSKITIKEGDLFDLPIENASVVIMNYTLQFIDPLKREKLIRRIYKGLRHNGILLVSDKMLQSNTDSSRIFIENYYDMKRSNGYSDLEISQKREALENVLIPYSVKEEVALFRNCGFEAIDMFFTWYNFSSFICTKKNDEIGDY